MFAFNGGPFETLLVGFFFLIYAALTLSAAIIAYIRRVRHRKLIVALCLFGLLVPFAWMALIIWACSDDLDRDDRNRAAFPVIQR